MSSDEDLAYLGVAQTQALFSARTSDYIKQAGIKPQ